MNKEVVELKKSLNECLTYLVSKSKSISEELRNTENMNIAFESIVEFSENCFLLQQVQITLKNNNENIDFNFEKLNEYLMEINGGLERGDYFLVADVFEYEVIPLFESKRLSN